MKKEEIKRYLQILRKNNRLEKNDQGLYKVIIYKRCKEIYIPDWAFMVLSYLKEFIKNTKDNLLKEIIKMYYFDNLNDLEIISKLPISETLYYKYKRTIFDNIYHLLIYEGFVTKKDIEREVSIDGCDS